MDESNKENSERTTGNLDADLNNVIMNLTDSLLKKQETKDQLKKEENAVDMNALFNHLDLNSIMSKMTNLLIDDTLKNSFKGMDKEAVAAPENNETSPEKPEKADHDSVSEKLDKIMSDLSDIKEELAYMRKKQKSIIEVFENMGWGRRKKN
jgi:hypothetical protein